MKKRWAFLFLGLLLCWRADAQAGAPANYGVNSEKSKLQISVSKEGLFKAFGHDHLISANKVSGSVPFNEQTLEDSSIDLTVKADSLTVVDPGESDTDRRQVQSTMAGKDVLDTEKYPEIHFTSTSVKGKKTGDGWEVMLEGRLSLHGVAKPISLPIRLSRRAGELSAEGDVSLLQTDFGITPIKVGGTAVKVKDKIRIHFDVVADGLGP
jgi:polyisoprenoid-binding protein YceI